MLSVKIEFFHDVLSCWCFNASERVRAFVAAHPQVELELTLSVPLVGVKVSFSPQALAKAAGPVGEAVADVVEGVGSGAGQVLEGLATVGDKAIDLVGDVVGKVTSHLDEIGITDLAGAVSAVVSASAVRIRDLVLVI